MWRNHCRWTSTSRQSPASGSYWWSRCCRVQPHRGTLGRTYLFHPRRSSPWSTPASPWIARSAGRMKTSGSGACGKQLLSFLGTNLVISNDHQRVNLVQLLTKYVAVSFRIPPPPEAKLTPFSIIISSSRDGSMNAGGLGSSIVSPGTSVEQNVTMTNNLKRLLDWSHNKKGDCFIRFTDYICDSTAIAEPPVWHPVAEVDSVPR